MLSEDRDARRIAYEHRRYHRFPEFVDTGAITWFTRYSVNVLRKDQRRRFVARKDGKLWVMRPREVMTSDIDDLDLDNKYSTFGLTGYLREVDFLYNYIRARHSRGPLAGWDELTWDGFGHTCDKCRELDASTISVPIGVRHFRRLCDQCAERTGVTWIHGPERCGMCGAMAFYEMAKPIGQYPRTFCESCGDPKAKRRDRPVS
jgi:hypothetical protein